MYVNADGDDVNHAPAPPWAEEGSKATCRSLGLAARVFFRCTSPRLILLFTLLPLAARIATGGYDVWEPLLVAVIALGWGIQEHWAHEHLLHAKPFHLFGRQFDLYTARRHRAHHNKPWDLGMTLLPPRVVVIAFPISCALWWWIAPSPELALTGITAYSAMALAYEWTHYLTHVPYPPKSRFYKRICRSHRWHHFKNENYWYGFTNPYVDDLFRTAPDPATVERSPTVRTLGVENEDPDAFLI